MIVLDPKRVNADNNVITRAMRADEASLATHAARYDVTAILQTRQPCVTETEAILNEQATEAIRQTEDDAQFARRRDAAQKALAAFQRAMSLAPDVSRSDLQLTYRLFVTKFDDRGQPIGGLPRPRAEWEKRIGSVTDKGVCHARYLLVVNDWWKKQRADLDAKREANEATKAADARKAVLSRRFAPVTLECSENWRSTTPKCDELPGLSDDERMQCRAACQSAADEGFKRSFQNALATCVDEFERGSLRSCEVKKPAGSAVPDEEVTRGVAECKSSCRTQGLQARAQRRPATTAGARSSSADGQGMKQCLDACQRIAPSNDDAALVQSCIDECGSDSSCVGSLGDRPKAAKQDHLKSGQRR